MTKDDEPAIDTATIWREFSRRLRGFIAARLSDPADVDDVLQSVYLRIHLGLPSLASDTRLEAWLYRVTRNAIIDFYRSRAAAANAVAALEEESVETEPDDADLADSFQPIFPSWRS
jgi:RNA polymerase sigma-70 factor (ECF subfamily)